MLSTGYGRLKKWCLLILAKAILLQCPERSLSQVGMTQQCSTIHSLTCPRYTESDQPSVYWDIPSLSPNCPARLMVHLIFLLHCCMTWLALLTQTVNSYIVQCFTNSCQTDLISCQVNLISVFDKVTKLNGS